MNPFDNGVKEEKAAVIRHNNSKRSFQNLFCLVEAAVAITVLCYWSSIPLPWPSFFLSSSLSSPRPPPPQSSKASFSYLFPPRPPPPTTAEIAGLEALRWWIGSALGKTCTVFVAVNALVVLIFFLSCLKAKTERDLYDHYSAAAGRYPVVDEERNPYEDKTVGIHREVVKTTVTEVKKCRRIKLESLEPQREKQSEFRGRETAELERRMLMEESASTWRSREMGELSCEEFRLTVATFIMEKRRTLLRNDAVGLHDDEMKRE